MVFRRPLAAAAAALAALAAASCTRSPAPPVAPPNVLLVVVDTLRADHLGCHGYGRPTSPRLDALARSGARFARAHASSSWTAPSVASILTGLYPVRHGVELPSSRLRPASATMAQAFQAAGYATAAFSANPAFVSARQGFERGFDEFTALHGGPAAPGEADVMPAGGGGANDVKVANAAVATDAALAWLASADPAKPYFLYVHYFDPHAGYYPPAEVAERFGVPATSPLLTAAQKRYWKERPGPEELRTLEALYDAEIAFTDRAIGRLLDGLPAARPTLVVVTADHGEEFLDHGGVSHGRTLFQEQLHVPLIVAGAGVAPQPAIERPVSIADVWPTVGELAGLAAPAQIDGLSLAPAVRGGEAPRRAVFADMRRASEMQDMIHRHAAVDWPWKLLEGMDEGAALYDLASDPDERHDRAAGMPARLEPLRGLLTARDGRSGAAAAGRAEPAPTSALTAEDKERMRALGYEPD